MHSAQLNNYKRSEIQLENKINQYLQSIFVGLMGHREKICQPEMSTGKPMKAIFVETLSSDRNMR